MTLKKIKRVNTVPSLPELIKVDNLTQRVAVYARVSTDHEDQQTSLEAQKDYYTKLIEANANWTLAGIYADDGVTGTSYLKRVAFKQMIADCEEGMIDRIITKSVSRFARNTVDALNAIRKLKELGIGVYFEKENIWTLDSKGEFLITLMTSLAQEESRSISENVTWGHRKRFADGRYSCAYSRFLGYDYGFRVNEEEAKVVKMIYKMFLQGLTPHTIALRLTDMGVTTPSGLEGWNQSTVRSILKNEKYKGAALLQKYFTTDFIGHKTKKNEGEVNQYYVENGHEAIIAPWLFDYVQGRLKARGDINSRYSGVSLYSSKFICARCGAIYGVKPEHSNDKYRQNIWMCRNRFKKGIYCRNIRIRDADVENIICDIARHILKKRKRVIEACSQLLREYDCEFHINAIKDMFGYADMEDLGIAIEKIVVFPDGFADVHIIGDKKYKVKVSDKPLRDYGWRGRYGNKG